MVLGEVLFAQLINLVFGLCPATRTDVMQLKNWQTFYMDWDASVAVGHLLQNE